MKCNCKPDETTGYTTVKCCNNCGLPIPGESWDIPVKNNISTKEFLKQHKRVINSPNLMPWYEITDEKMKELISVICDEKEGLVINELKKHGYNLDYVVYESKNPET